MGSDNKKTQPLLSVIITAYQAEKFLEECLQSVALSSYQNLQIVLVDDGSTDNTADICDRWAKRDPRISYYPRPHEGRISSLVFAHEHAEGVAQCVVDADDRVKPGAFTRSISKLSNSHQLVYTYRDLIDPDGNFIRSHSKNKIEYRPLQILVDNMIFHLRTFTTDLFVESGGVGRFERCEDWDQNLRMSEHTSVRCIPQALYEYRLHENQISRTPQQNEEGAIAVRDAIERRNLKLDLVVDDNGFHIKKRSTPAPLALPEIQK